jgi:general secretion pathway protein H
LPCERSRKSGGFTLVELLVVLALLALTAAMVVPFLGHAVPRSALAAAAAEIRAALRGAGSEAIAEGRTVTFRGDRGSGYWLDRRYHRLTLTGKPVRIAVAGAGRVAFFASGGSSGGRVWIESRDGKREIDIDPVTGRAALKP